MAYKKQDMIDQSIKAIKKHKLFFIDDIFAYVDFCNATFYNNKLEKVDSIKAALSENRIKTKQSLKAKWYQSDNATVQIALHKLIGTEEEYHRLANTKITTDHTSGGDKINICVTPPKVD